MEKVMGINFMLLAALFVGLSNLFMRKSVDAGGDTKAFLMVQMVVVFLVAVLLNPVLTKTYGWSWPMAIFGVVGGLVLCVMMNMLGKSLQSGPAGLTFAALNASCVVPILFMVFLCGEKYGFVYDLWKGLGSLLVVGGLFWAGWETSNLENKPKWIAFVMATFWLHVLFLLFLQWRGLFVGNPDAEGLFLSFDLDDIRSEWFMPMVFLTVALMQVFIFKKEGRKPVKAELKYGLYGGILNGVGTFFMIKSTEFASPFEHAIIFPIFSVGVILVCNIWGRRLYKEKVNWAATLLCVGGILVGSINWAAIIK